MKNKYKVKTQNQLKRAKMYQNKNKVCQLKIIQQSPNHKQDKFLKP